jgi:transcriptional regulator with XRE-family HTH domain
MTIDLKKPTSTAVADATISRGPAINGMSREDVERISPALGTTHVHSLGRRMAAFREHLKLTQGELAKRLGKSRATVNQYETGKIDPPLRMVDKIANILAVDPSILAFGSEGGDSRGERIRLTPGDSESEEFIEFSKQAAKRLGLQAASDHALELKSDEPTFGLRRGDLIFVDLSVQRLRGDGHLYAVSRGSGGLSIVRTSIELDETADKLKIIFGSGQISEVDAMNVKVHGWIKATTRRE